MISFRYHLVSIVAVFFALALGVLVGTTVGSQGAIDQLTVQLRAAINDTHRLQDQVGDLQRNMRTWEVFGREVEPLLIDGSLEGTRVVVVTAQDVDVSELSGVKSALGDSKAELMGVLALTSQMTLASDEARTGLADLLQVSVNGSASEIATEAARLLGRRLADGVDITSSDGSDDLLAQMVQRGYLADRDVRDGLAGMGGPDQVVIVLSGGLQPPVVQPVDFFLPLVTSLSQVGQVVAAAETSTTVYPFVPLVREASSDSPLVTVDNADMLPGRIGLVLGLRDLIRDGQGGDYGIKPGASGLIPKG